LTKAQFHAQRSTSVAGAWKSAPSGDAQGESAAVDIIAVQADGLSLEPVGFYEWN
jgi:hypothetical protein